MADIMKAIEIEQIYLKHRAKGEYPFHLVDKIRECGFESLEQYFTKKKIHQLTNLKFSFVNQPMPGGVAEIFNMIATKKPGVLFVDWERTFVVCGIKGLEDYNKEFCEENNITVFPLYTGGGTIVGSKGDFSFGVCCPGNVDMTGKVILEEVAQILQKHTKKPVTVSGNDILHDGYKICGSASYTNDFVFMHIMHFSFADWSELISQICTTTKKGKPVGYIDFVTRDVFKSEVAEWLAVLSI